MNDKFLDEIYRFINNLNLTKEELQEINLYVDTINSKLTNLHKKIKNKKFEKLKGGIIRLIKEEKNDNN